MLAKHVNNSLSIFLEWRNPDISSSFASNISALFSRVLHDLTSGPEATVRSLSSITDSDKQQIFKWNAIAPTTVERCIHHLIEDQVESHSEKEAVCAWDGSFTYLGLDRLATKLASHLIQLGVCPENRVVLCMDKSVCGAKPSSLTAKMLIEVLEMERRGYASRAEGRRRLCSLGSDAPNRAYSGPCSGSGSKDSDLLAWPCFSPVVGSRGSGSVG